MKKYIIAVMALAISTVALAKDPIKTTSGNPAAIQGKSVFVEINYDDMIVVDEDTKKEMSLLDFCKMKGEDWVADMGKDNVEALESFNEMLSKKAKKFEVTENRSSADYILTVKTDRFSYGNPYAMMGAFMSKDVWGFFIGKFIIKTPAGETVAEMSCDKINADGTKWTWTQQKAYLYELTAKELASFLNKAK